MKFEENLKSGELVQAKLSNLLRADHQAHFPPREIEQHATHRGGLEVHHLVVLLQTTKRRHQESGCDANMFKKNWGRKVAHRKLTDTGVVHARILG